MLWLKTARRVSPRVSFLAEGWTALRGPLEAGDATGELREAFVDLRFGRLDLRAGRQIIAWGRADGVNPTDNLSGQDLTLLVPDDVERRLGTTAVRASYYLGDVSLTGVWLPEFRGHEFALPAPPPGIAYVREDQQWPADQWAVRAEQTGRTVDWSVSYFHGKDLAPDLGVAGRAGGAPGVQLSHHRVRVFGADMAANVGRFGVRAEGAYVGTEDPGGTRSVHEEPVHLPRGGNRPDLWRAAESERAVPVSPRAGRTPPCRRVPRISPRSWPRSRRFSTARRAARSTARRSACRYKWLHDTLEAECAAAGYAGPSGSRGAAEGRLCGDRRLEGARWSGDLQRRNVVALWPDAP